MDARALLLAALVLSTAVVALPGAAEAATSKRYSVFGDDGATSNTRATVEGALADGAQGHIGLGDYYYWAPPEDWRAILKPLLDKGAHMIRGNHDDPAKLQGIFPSGTTWSANLNGVRAVGIDSTKRVDVGSTQYEFAKRELCGAAEPVRVLLTHHNWWLLDGAKHPGSEFPGSASAMDKLVQDCGVDLVLAGHEHNYQRMMRGGVPYLIVGTGGQSLYAVNGAPSGTVAKHVGYGRLLLDLSAGGFSARFKSNDGVTRDTFSYTASTGGSTAPPPPSGQAAVTFAPEGGNEWWVQTRIGGDDAAKVVRVEARDGGGAWSALTYRSWGAWAASHHVEPGNKVEYRATLSDGRTVTSCRFEHPTGGCAADGGSTGGGGAFDATFSTNGGNEWWVEVKVDANQPLGGVDARVDGGSWRALTKRSWGAWAASFKVPDGSRVEFRATSTTGASDTSGAYVWPTGAPASASGFDATFHDVRGSAWWVETEVDVSGGTLAGVEARTDGGAWTALMARDWGSWAKSMKAGSTVEFRARSTTGATDVSAVYAWPPG